MTRHRGRKREDWIPKVQVTFMMNLDDYKRLEMAKNYESVRNLRYTTTKKILNGAFRMWYKQWYEARMISPDQEERWMAYSERLERIGQNDDLP